MNEENVENTPSSSKVTPEWLASYFIGVTIGNLIYGNPKTFITYTGTEIQKEGDDSE